MASTDSPDAEASSGFGASLDSRVLEQWVPKRLRHPGWIGWRLRGLLVAALFGCLALFLLTRELAHQPALGAAWRAGAGGQLELAAADDARLRTFEGETLTAIGGGDAQVHFIDSLVLARSARWLTRDADRQRFVEQQRRLHEVMAARTVQLYFADGRTVELQLAPLGIGGLGPLYWLVAALALVLYLVALVVLFAQPGLRNGLFAAMALAQCGNLVYIAAQATPGLAVALSWAAADAPARTVFDLLTAAALLHATAVHPLRVPSARAIAVAGWSVAILIALALLRQQLSQAWWWTQLAGAVLGIAAIAVLGWSHRIEPHPFAMVLRRFGVATVGTWTLLTLGVAAAQEPGLQQQIASVGSMVWVVFLASLMLLMPFLAKSQQVMREFALLAGVSTVATSLDLLFISLFSIGQTVSIALSLFLSLGVYIAGRTWLVNQLRGTSVITMERLFERLYRIVRNVERHPRTAGAQLLGLMRELFEPLEATVAARGSAHARVSRDGSTLLVPVPDLSRPSGRAEQTLVLRYSHHGRRLFTEEDARLAERIVDQLRRAVAYDQAVERGRSEERSRIAQDLHDDIGARLLTLMYQAASPEQEDYIRHTLQDLKTLTRGLAVGGHRLSHALAEWKADATQRLGVAQIALSWDAQLDGELDLSVVQWSALTRVLRELLSNAITHAQCSRVEVNFTLDAGALTLAVSDDGRGERPQDWSHGLGLGGIRKRVKQLGGEVRWQQLQPHGIGCVVRVPRWSAPSDGGRPAAGGAQSAAASAPAAAGGVPT
ncbi:sensor histidine kinase [Caldimonas sp. KR1-144]|uniref:sensor histidine kinase n=1 Tax=Caldimonas sp. KR1-144 TaxID=3400911 RepID=UPI003C086568